jgi:hypothetical protein
MFELAFWPLWLLACYLSSNFVDLNIRFLDWVIRNAPESR